MGYNQPIVIVSYLLVTTARAGSLQALEIYILLFLFFILTLVY